MSYELIVESDKIRSVSDLPTDDTQTDPLRRLVNHWRQLANSMSSTGQPSCLFAGAAVYELADQLTALLNEGEVAKRRDFKIEDYSVLGLNEPTKW